MTGKKFTGVRSLLVRGLVVRDLLVRDLRMDSVCKCRSCGLSVAVLALAFTFIFLMICACVIRKCSTYKASFQVCYEVRITENLEVDFGEDHQETDPHIVRLGWSKDCTSFQLGIHLRSHFVSLLS